MSTTKRRGRGARRNGRRATAPRSASAQRGTADQRPSRASRRPRTAPKNVDKTEQMFYNMYSRLCGQTFLRRSPVRLSWGGALCRLTPHYCTKVLFGAIKSYCCQYVNGKIRRISPRKRRQNAEYCRQEYKLTPSRSACICRLSGSRSEGQGRCSGSVGALRRS